jgi:hypothetical protein
VAVASAVGQVTVVYVGIGVGQGAENVVTARLPKKFDPVGSGLFGDSPTATALFVEATGVPEPTIWRPLVLFPDESAISAAPWI